MFAKQSFHAASHLAGKRRSNLVISALALILVFSVLSFSVQAKATGIGKAKATKWVGTWSTAPQLVEPHNMPPAPGLSNNTIRQIVRVSIGGDSLRVKFSNEFSKSAVTLRKVQVAVSAGGSALTVAPLRN